MKVKKYSAAGAESGTATVTDVLFGAPVNEPAIHAVIRTENRNRRHGTHKTKDFAEVSGGGKKPWRQKGTGHARQGSIRAPQWRHGAVALGPQPRDYRIGINDKVRRLGIVSILSKKAGKEQVALIDSLAIAEYSTKTIHGIFKKAGYEGSPVVYVTDSSDQKLQKSFGNLPNAKIMHAQRLNAPELLYADCVFFSEGAIKYLEGRYKLERKRKPA
ncbi:MAG: 50S ribosomal protein L4 [Spirochaetia bacterium]|nr:50S ribosomal protein L4 [Spirochaetia bacterium]